MRPFRNSVPDRGSARAALASDPTPMIRMYPASSPRSAEKLFAISHIAVGRQLASFGPRLLLLALLVCVGSPLLHSQSTERKRPAPAASQVTTPVRFLHWAIPDKPSVAAFVHVNVVPMDREEIFKDQTVLIRDGHIEQIGKTAELAVPPKALTIDGTGKYLIPGLVDMRAHVCSPAELLLDLAHGVTMVRTIDSRPQHLAWRDAVNQGKLLAPIIFAAGPTISGAGTPLQVKQAVMQQIRTAYDAVEAADNLPPDDFHGITSVARALGISVFGGVNLNLGLKDTITAPQFFSLETTRQFARAVFHDNADTPDDDVSRAAAVMRDAKIWFTPSLESFANEHRRSSSPTASLPENNSLPQQCAQAESIPAEATDEAWQAHWGFYKKIVATMHRERVPLILGTNASLAGAPPGVAVQRELVYLVEAGLTPFDALQTATKNASEWFVHPEGGGVFGTISLHERADLVLLDANPLADIGNVTKVRGVMVQGRWLPQPELQKMLKALPAAYAQERKFLTTELATSPAAASKYLQQNDPYHRLADDLQRKRIKGVAAGSMSH